MHYWTLLRGEYTVCVLLVLSLENGLAFVGIDTTKYSEEQVDKLLHGAELMMGALFKVPIDLGKLTPFGRAMIARKYILGTSRV